jgi:uncharacterized protein (DUF302 family)
MEKTKSDVGYHVPLQIDFNAAIERVTAALKVEGFGVLTEIDVKATLKKKINADFRPYKILGACNPPIAHQALISAPEVGLFLPCNVTVDQISDDTVLVSLVDPMAMLGVMDNPNLNALAEDVDQRLQRVAAALAA